MTREKAIHKMKFSKDAYQKLIDEEVDKGILIGTGIKGEWEADAPLTEEYVAMRDSCDMAARSLEAWEKVRQEIIKQSAKVPTVQNEYLKGLKTAYAHTLAIIDEHLQEVEHEAGD